MFGEILSFYHEIVCWVCSLESPHLIQLLYRRSKRFPLIIHHLLPDLAPGLAHNGSNYPYLEQIFMVPKRFEPSKFDCKYKWTVTTENIPSDRCTQRRFRSACIFPQSDKNLHWTHFGPPRMESFFMRTTKTLIRLCGCADSFESSLGAHICR